MVKKIIKEPKNQAAYDMFKNINLAAILFLIYNWTFRLTKPTTNWWIVIAFVLSVVFMGNLHKQ